MLLNTKNKKQLHNTPLDIDIDKLQQACLLIARIYGDHHDYICDVNTLIVVNLIHFPNS